jgi:Lon protease-like protein
MSSIALFPLKNVLFPSSVLPIHVFEGRYINLINECFREKKEFGINLKESGKVYEFGCLAKVSDIVKFYPDGRMDVLIEGTERFFTNHKSIANVGYYVADIEIIPDSIGVINRILLSECVDYYNFIVEHIKNIQIKTIGIEDLHPEKPSYFLAQKSGLNLAQKYELLIMNHENNRLQYLLSHLRNIKPLIEEAEFVSQIIKNDGYYRPSFDN